MRLSDFFKTWRVQGSAALSRVFGEFIGGIYLSEATLAQAPATVTYSAAPVPDVGLAAQQVITVTDGVAFVVGAPLFCGQAMTATLPVTGGAIWYLTIRNTSGGAHGAITFNAVFKIAATAIAIATATSRTFAFAWNGTNHVELWRGAADVAN
jgi:hypothetical protein